MDSYCAASCSSIRQERRYIVNPETKAAHTPTPWIFDEVATSCGRCFRIGSRENIDGHKASKRLGSRTLPAYACIYDDFGSGETINKANAEFIVRAVNSYHQLLAALKGMYELPTTKGIEMKFHGRDTLSYMAKIIAAADDAIRKAEGRA